MQEIPAYVGVQASEESSAPQYLTGQALDAAEASDAPPERVYPLIHPQDNSVGVSNWAALEALLRYALFTCLGLPTRPLGYHILFLFPASLSLGEREVMTQILFEKLHLSALMMFDRPTAQLYAAGYVSGLVLDVGRSSTQMTFLADNDIALQSSTPLGEADCDNYLAHLIQQTNPAILSTLQDPSAKHDALLKIVHSLKLRNAIHFDSELVQLPQTNGHDQPPPPDLESAQAPPLQTEEDSGANDVTQALMQGKEAAGEGQAEEAEADSNPAVVTVTHPLDPSLPPISIGPERHRWAEPLFDASLLLQCGCTPEQLHTKLDLIQAVQTAVKALPTALPQHMRHSTVWEHVVLGGYAARVHNLGLGLVTKLDEVLIDRHHRHPQDPQPKSRPSLAKMPDYFSEYKGRPDWLSFLGGCILAKVSMLPDLSAGTQTDKRLFDSCSLATTSLQRLSM